VTRARATTEAVTNGARNAGDFEQSKSAILEGFNGRYADRENRARCERQWRSPQWRSRKWRERKRTAWRAAEPVGPDAAALRAQDRTSRPAASCPTRKNSSANCIRSTATNAEQQPPITSARKRRNFSLAFLRLCSTARPTQKTYMCRLRIPNGILSTGSSPAWPISPSATRRYAHVTTRRQPANARGRAENAIADGEAIPVISAVLARLGCRQHPQRHRHADCRHRSARTARHKAVRARLALPHPQQPLAVRHSAQVQRRLRRRRRHSGAGRHQRHRLPSGRGQKTVSARTGHLVPAHARGIHRPQRLCPRYRRHRQA